MRPNLGGDAGGSSSVDMLICCGRTTEWSDKNMSALAGIGSVWQEHAEI